MRLIFFQDLPDPARFGIQIPILDTRISSTLEALRSHPTIGPGIEELLEQNETEEISRDDLEKVHSARYVHGLYSEELEQLLLSAYELVDENGNYHRYDPSAAQEPLARLFQTQLRRAAGSLQCMRTALTEGFCFFFGGGFHHAHGDFGHGFCPINDIVIGIRRLQAERLVEKVWVIDGDAHKGDGTAALTRDDDSIATLSVHMAEGWPLDIENPKAEAHQHPSYTPSTVDIPIEEGGEEDYNSLLAAGLKELEEIMPGPDLAVVVFGADPYEKDELESAKKLKLSLDQLQRRDELIYHSLSDRAIPAAYLMAGGYGPHAWEVNYQFLERVLSERS